MMPAFRSASIAICLPGMASNAKRALTSETRPAPLVTTTKLMMVRTMNTTAPTAKLPPMTNSPNAAMTLPAACEPSWPCISTTRVDATLSARRRMVTSSSTVGKIANSSGRLTLNTAMTMTSDSAMLNVNSTSRITGGSGRIIIARIEMSPTGTPMLMRSSVTRIAELLVVCHGFESV